MDEQTVAMSQEEVNTVQLPEEDGTVPSISTSQTQEDALPEVANSLKGSKKSLQGSANVLATSNGIHKVVDDSINQEKSLHNSSTDVKEPFVTENENGDVTEEPEVGDNTVIEQESRDDLGETWREDIGFSLGSLYGGDDEDAGWQNEAYGLFTEQTGEDAYEQLTDTQFKSEETQSTGLFSSIEDKFREFKLAFSTTSTLPQDDTSPRPVGGSGFAKVVSNPKFPKHPFFSASRIFRVRMRHNNLSFEDDAMLDGRVTCLKITDDNSREMLDLILHTGKVPQYYSANCFKDFTEAFKGGTDNLKDWVFQKPINYYSRIENVRRGPDSYYDQRYYSQVTYAFTDVDDVAHVARLRLMPADGCQETGKPDKQDQENVWETKRLDGEKREKMYLRKEYVQRLTNQPLQYRLQIQVRLLEENIRATPTELNSTREEKDTENNDNLSTENGSQDIKKKEEESDDAATEEPPLPIPVIIELAEKYKVYNSCVEWDPDEYPWLDLAIITMTTPMSEEHLRKTKFQLTNQVPSFSPAIPVSTRGFRSLVLAVKEFHGIGENQSKEVAEYNVPVESTTKYKIAVVTGRVVNAGTDADVCITITGLTGTTKPINLDQRFHDDFEPGQCDEFEETGNQVGEIMVVEMQIKSSFVSRRWFLDEVSVTDVNSKMNVRFPCYQWLTSKHSTVVLRRADSLAPQNELQIFPYLQRKVEIAQRRMLYQWDEVQGLPGRLNVSSYENLPEEIQFSREKEQDLREKFLRNLANTGTGSVLTFRSWNIFEDNSKLLTKFLKDIDGVRRVIEHWKTDEEFGRQILNGTHPTRIERVMMLPNDFASKKDMLETMLDRDTSLDQEIEDGHVYLLTYPELDNLQQETDCKGKYKRYVTSPSCLLYVRKDGHLVPIAITLCVDDGATLWTPHDNINDWVFAKMWVRCADAQVHQVCSRHLYTQLVMEAFAVATYRNLPSAHPVFKLLHPHLRYTIAVNVLGRKHLYPADEGLFHKYLAVGGQHDDLLKESYRHFSLGDLNLPLDLENRGVHDPEKLPNYHYRDDALALWNVIKKLVRTVLHMQYWNDFSVQGDEELQDWIQDIHEHGLPEWELAGEHNVPNCLWTLDELIEFVTMVIFTASCQHAALTTGMVDTYAYIPNAPTMMLTPPPKSKQHIRVADMRKALPNKAKAGEIIAACYTLSNLSKDEVFLGEFPENVWEDKAVLAAIDGFRVDLQRVQEKIEARNEALDIPYTYLMPSKIPKSAS